MREGRGITDTQLLKLDEIPCRHTASFQRHIKVETTSYVYGVLVKMMAKQDLKYGLISLEGKSITKHMHSYKHQATQSPFADFKIVFFLRVPLKCKNSLQN